MNSYQINKSSFLKGIQCEKQLYLFKQHYDWQDPVSESQQAIFEFIENLLRDTEGDGDILVYNQALETSRLKEIAREFPKYANDIEERLTRIRDLMVPFRKKYYYKSEMKGSYSIKYVLPALVPNLSYEGLEIAEEGAAMNAFESLIYETDFIKIEETRKYLLEYCKVDTLAMVEILNVLNL